MIAPSEGGAETRSLSGGTMRPFEAGEPELTDGELTRHLLAAVATGDLVEAQRVAMMIGKRSAARERAQRLAAIGVAIVATRR